MALLIDTSTVPPGERLDLWLESSSGAYHPLQARSAEREAFWGRMWGHELGPLAVFRIVAAPNTMIRTARAIAARDPERLHLSVVVRGRIDAAQEGRSTVVRAGDLFAYETSRPTVLRADRPFESLVVSLPRQLLGADAARVSRTTAVRIPGGEGLPRAAATYLCRLTSRLERGAVADEDVPQAVECVVDLVRRLYAGPGEARGPRVRSRAEILLDVESFIEENLGDPELAPQAIARASFISTRYLHRLFQSEGATVSRWIRECRLERCRRDLLDPELRHETILEIASRWGLPGPQHFSRLFRSAYGCSPRELRREAERVPAAGWAARAAVPAPAAT